jgi:hypothetical protein
MLQILLKRARTIIKIMVAADKIQKISSPQMHPREMLESMKDITKEEILLQPQIEGTLGLHQEIVASATRKEECATNHHATIIIALIKASYLFL